MKVSKIFTTFSGERVKFIYNDGKWQATIQPAFGFCSTKRKLLPVVSLTDITSLLLWLHGQDTLTCRSRVHLTSLSSSDDDECVLLGKYGLFGGENFGAEAPVVSQNDSHNFESEKTELDKHLRMIETLKVISTSEKHPDLADSLSNVGNIYLNLGDVKKGLTYHLQALAMRMKIYGNNKPHPQVAASLSNVGRAYSKLSIGCLKNSTNDP